GVVNFTVEVKEWQERILFLHTIARGAADRSYGIHVAELAGLPAPVVRRAREVLADLESADLSPPSVRPSRDDGPQPGPVQLSLFSELAPPPALKELQAINPDDLTPRQALETLYRLKRLADRG
ncbi:MAG: hypothetical protein H7831_12525, partial [Magnetococcus sp. WYHC-3]